MKKIRKGIKVIRTYKDHLSKRGLFLVLFGLAYGVIGLSYIRGPIPLSIRSTAYLHELVMPLEYWGYVWMIAGVVVLLGGLFRTFGNIETLGYSIAELMPMSWSIMYFISQLIGGPGANRAYLTATVYLVMASAVFCVAGMVDPKDVRRQIRKSRG